MRCNAATDVDNVILSLARELWLLQLIKSFIAVDMQNVIAARSLGGQFPGSSLFCVVVVGTLHTRHNI